jgi:hypothetical protein
LERGTRHQAEQIDAFSVANERTEQTVGMAAEQHRTVREIGIRSVTPKSPSAVRPRSEDAVARRTRTAICTPV